MCLQGVVRLEVFLADAAVNVGSPTGALVLESHVLNHGLIIRKHLIAVRALGRRTGRVVHRGLLRSLRHLVPKSTERA
jgi:hypothetical protein